MSLSCPYSEAHFCSLSTQSNVYGLAKVCFTRHANKIIVASLSGEIICLEYCSIQGDLTPVSREVQFTYIPVDAEIVSIDAFAKSSHGNGVVVGITFIKDILDEKPSQFLNIYSDWEPGSEFNLDEIAQSCQSLELQYVPYQLTHHKFVYNGLNEIVYLLSGSDQRIHLFREDKSMHTFSEQAMQDFFPEFVDPLPGCVLWTDIKSFAEHKRRISAVGCQNGFVLCFLVDTETKEILNSWKIEHGGPVTSVKLFTTKNCVEYPLILSDYQTSMSDSSEFDNKEVDFHLLVTGALEVSVVYMNVITHGFSQQVVLPHSDVNDSTLCCCVCDIDFDGQNEILLGTYGQELLVYKYVDSENSSQHPGEYKLQWQRSFSYPILAVDKIDITGDGLKEFAVLTTKGLHILQHNLEVVREVCLEKLTKCLKQYSRTDDPFQLLQAETFTDQETPHNNEASDGS